MKAVDGCEPNEDNKDKAQTNVDAAQQILESPHALSLHLAL